MELAGLVAEGFPEGGFVRPGAELAEVLGRAGDGVAEELEFDAAEGFACEVGGLVGWCSGL